MSRNAPTRLHSVQETPQDAQKQPWDRQPGERAADYMRFLTYLQMGRGRSLQAVSDAQREAKKARKGQENTNASTESAEETHGCRVVSISGAIKRASVAWSWVERAEAFDLWYRWETHKRTLAFLDHEAHFLTRAQRLQTLDTIMHGLMGVTLENPHTADSYQIYLQMHRQLLATLREIRREMAAIDKMDISTFSDLGERLV